MRILGKVRNVKKSNTGGRMVRLSSRKKEEKGKEKKLGGKD